MTGWLDEPGRRRAGESLVEVAAALHRVDVEAVGLADLGRHDGYVARQMRRWYGQYQQSRGATPLIDRVHDRLQGRLPAEQRVSRRARRLPARQLHHHPRRHDRGGAGLGDLHARRPAGRSRLRCWPRGRSPATSARSPPRRPAARVRLAGPTSPSHYRARTDLDCSDRGSTSPSPTGSWPASTRASGPATTPGSCPRRASTSTRSATSVDWLAERAAEALAADLLRPDRTPSAADTLPRHVAPRGRVRRPHRARHRGGVRALALPRRRACSRSPRPARSSS